MTETVESIRMRTKAKKQLASAAKLFQEADRTEGREPLLGDIIVSIHNAELFGAAYIPRVRELLAEWEEELRK